MEAMAVVGVAGPWEVLACGGCPALGCRDLGDGVCRSVLARPAGRGMRERRAMFATNQTPYCTGGCMTKTTRCQTTDIEQK